ncbi:MAG: VCBS repeat-containing protein, partial [Acidobacteriales bacterium]|nr:VCBS repeat-containing protein [Terriglobales bacterium]
MLLHASAQRRPQKPAAPGARFEDVARAAGLDNFKLTCGSLEKRYIMDAMCGGAAFLDFDNDAWLDILLVNGSTLEEMKSPTPGRCAKEGIRLYRNLRNGSFADVTAKSGLVRAAAGKTCWGFGVAVGDYDNDGWKDVYVTYLDGGALFRNQGNRTFQDVTAKAGADNAGSWGTSAAFGDYDNDGRLDLYIANYVSLDFDNLPVFGSGPFCQYRGIPVSCGPRGLHGARDRLYHNNGDGTFSDVTEKNNIDPDAYYGLGVIWGDVDKDGCDDIYVANDSSPSLLYRNNCKGGFSEVGVTAGVAYSVDGREQAGMGVDFGDYDNDGWPDLAKTNFSDDTNNLYHNEGDGEFTDQQAATGFGPVSIPFLGFGVKFFDFDNDGWQDIFVANGHVNPQVDQHKFGVTYAQRNLLFHNLGKSRFEEIGLKAGVPFRVRKVARGAATGDFDNDGRMDLLVTHLGDVPTLLRNLTPATGNWIKISLVGTKSNRDGL